MPGNEVLQTISASNDSTVAVEVFKTGMMRKRKHILVFENFTGELHYLPEHPENSRICMKIDAASIACCDSWLKPKKRREVADYARVKSLDAGKYPEIRFESTRISAKALRGFVVEGELNIRGVRRMVKVNVVLSPMTKNRLQIDADASIHLSDFGIDPPTSFFGLIGTKDEATIHLLLWGKISSAAAAGSTPA